MMSSRKSARIWSRGKRKWHPGRKAGVTTGLPGWIGDKGAKKWILKKYQLLWA
jgi:hypothetical protein